MRIEALALHRPWIWTAASTSSLTGRGSKRGVVHRCNSPLPPLGCYMHQPVAMWHAGRQPSLRPMHLPVTPGAPPKWGMRCAPCGALRMPRPGATPGMTRPVGCWLQGSLRRTPLFCCATGWKYQEGCSARAPTALGGGYEARWTSSASVPSFQASLRHDPGPLLAPVPTDTYGPHTSVAARHLRCTAWHPPGLAPGPLPHPGINIWWIMLHTLLVHEER